MALALAIFATMLGLVVVRPRGWNEAWWTMFGAAAMVAFGFVTPREALDAALAGKSALLFLLSLLTLALLVGKSGFFEWTAIGCARIARGRGRALYRNMFVLGALVTTILSLDTTAVMLTPVVLALVKRLKLPAAPYVLMSAFVANVGSLALPISNLTNILFADAFRLTFFAFAIKMIAAQVVALAVAYGLLRWHFRLAVGTPFDDRSLPSPRDVVPHRPYFILCTVVLGLVLVGYFLAPLFGVAPYLVAFAGSAVLASAGAVTQRVHLRTAGELSWGIFPFVIGLFVAVRGIDGLGIARLSAEWLSQRDPGSTGTLLATAGATALASNIMNNLPAALVARSALIASHAPIETALAALVGADVGPLLTPFGSLATMLVLTLARNQGHEIRTASFVTFGLWAAPVITVSATLALVLGLRVL